jgi:hypothetical protein
VARYYASFTYQAQSWKKPRRVVAKVEWHPGLLYPTVGFIVTNLARPCDFQCCKPRPGHFGCQRAGCDRISLPQRLGETQNPLRWPGIRGMWD